MYEMSEQSNKKNKNKLVVVIVLISFILIGIGLGVPYIYSKLSNVGDSFKVDTSKGKGKKIKTDSSCVKQNFDLFGVNGMYFKSIKELSSGKRVDVKASYPLYKSAYCYEYQCAETETKLREDYNKDSNNDNKITKKSGFSTFRVIVSNGVATVYNYDEETMKLTFSKKLDLKNIKSVVVGDSGIWNILVLDSNNNLYVYFFETGDDQNLSSKKLVYKNVKDFTIQYLKGVTDYYLDDSNYADGGPMLDSVIIHTLDGKTFAINDVEEVEANKIDLTVVTEISTSVTVGFGEIKLSIASSNDHDYQKYNGSELKVKQLFAKNVTKNAQDSYNYDAIMHIITENDEHLYYGFDDCEYKYRLYNEQKVKSIEYNTQNKKAVITYVDDTKLEFEYDNKLDLN